MFHVEPDKPLVAGGASTAWSALGSLIGGVVRWWVMWGVGR